MKYRNYNSKRALPLVAFAAMAFATSCSNDSLSDGSSQSSTTGEGQAVELTASLNDDKSADTRVGMTKEESNKASFFWHKNEAILVQTKSGDSYPGTEFTTSATTGETTATFKGTVASGSTLGAYAVYPYSTSHKFTSETSLSYNLPATYTSYKPETQIFGTNANYPTNSTNILLVGKIENGKIDFKHIGGLAVIRIDKMPYETGTLTITADQQLSGDFKIENLSATDAQIATTTEGVSDADKKVTFTFSGASTESAGVFYLPLATGEYTNVKVTIGETVVDCGCVTISRAGVTAVSIATYEGTLTDYQNKQVRSYGSKKYYLGSNKYEINDHEFVDLGLSVLWATMNVGAESETANGSYFAWGETKTKDNFVNTYTYNETPATLDADHDAATANWGSGVRMPTIDECAQLVNSCNRSWTNSVCTLTSKNNNQSILLPLAGLQNSYDNKKVNTGVGYYRTSSFLGYKYNANWAYCLYLSSSWVETNGNQYSCSSLPNGLSIRAVADKP